MRRAVARGRIVPQSLSTDPRMGRVSLKAALLFPLMWINCDDQGRLSGDPDEIKYAACPNIDDIKKGDIPQLLIELEREGFLKVYTTSKTKAAQMLDWWEEQRLQWAYPSRYPPAPGWQDRLRYHPTPTEIVTENWPEPRTPKNNLSPDSKKLPSKLPKELPSNLESPPSQTLPPEKEKGKRNRRGRGILPSTLGSKSPPPLSGLSLLKSLKETFPQAFGRKPDSRETAQLRDLGEEISAAGGATSEQVHDAFKEAALGQKFSVSYVRAILLDWLGIERVRPP